jgi:hypothetical protein
MDRMKTVRLRIQKMKCMDLESDYESDSHYFDD